jgi:hypothetical protein
MLGRCTAGSVGEEFRPAVTRRDARELLLRACVLIAWAEVLTHLNKDKWDLLLGSRVMLDNAVDRLRDEFENQVQEHFLWLIAPRNEILFELNDIGMLEQLQEFQFATLEPPVLQHLLDCHSFARLNQRRLDREVP